MSCSHDVLLLLPLQQDGAAGRGLKTSGFLGFGVLPLHEEDFWAPALSYVVPFGKSRQFMPDSYILFPIWLPKGLSSNYNLLK